MQVLPSMIRWWAVLLHPSIMALCQLRAHRNRLYRGAFRRFRVFFPLLFLVTVACSAWLMRHLIPSTEVTPSQLSLAHSVGNFISLQLCGLRGCAALLGAFWGALWVGLPIPIVFGQSVCPAVDRPPSLKLISVLFFLFHIQLSGSCGAEYFPISQSSPWIHEVICTGFIFSKINSLCS